MTTFAYPNIRPSSQQWSLENFTAIYQSPFNARITTADRDGEHWKIAMAYADLIDMNRRLLTAFLFSLNGSQHRFTVRDFAFVRAGVGGGAPTVSGAGQTGKTLNIANGPTSTTGWLLAGDQIGVAGLLHSVDADVDTDGGGLAAISVSPRIFIPPNNGASVEIDAPTNSFVLDVPSVIVATKSPARSQVSFSALSSVQ